MQIIFIPYTEQLEEEKSDNGEYSIVGIPESEIKLLENLGENELKTELEKMPITKLVRVAYLSKKLGAEIMIKYNFRGLPMIHDKDLFNYQIEALQWMRKQESECKYGISGGIASLKMGMGKTLTGLSLSLMSPRPSYPEELRGFPTLVISSKTVMYEWRDNALTFFGNRIRVLLLHPDMIGDKAFKTITRDEVLNYDIVCTTYDVCLSICRAHDYGERVVERGDEHSLMKDKIISIHTASRNQSDDKNAIGPSIIYKTPWERVICDESQRFANPKTSVYKSIMAIYAKYKWCLTGTPIRNYDTDIWAQLRFLGYNVVKTAPDWNRTSHSHFKQENLTSFIYQLSYEDAGIKLPTKTEMQIVKKLDGQEKECYRFVLGAARKTYNEMMSNLVSFACVLAMFTRLRQVCIAPFLILPQSKKGYKEEVETDELGQHTKSLVESLLESNDELAHWLVDKNGTAGMKSKKITEIIEIIKKVPKGEKILIFSMFSSCLSLLTDAIKEYVEDFPTVQVDGSVTGKDRDAAITKFKTDETIRGMLLTYKVGAEGLNLTVATHVICIEPWWTPAVPNQAIARSWRTGQTKPVFVHNIIIDATIEGRILDICKDKHNMAKSYLDGSDRSVDKSARLDKYTLGKILGY